MENKEIKAIIESLLFTWGDPLDIKDISSILDIDVKEVEEIIVEMIDEFDYNMRGLRIIKINNSYQLGTRPEYYDWISKLISPKKEKNLSNAALETLSIIAYRQPVIKSDIENIRGVRSDRAVETLLERGLIEELGRMETIGRPILYGTTDLFLRAFGLSSLLELPELVDISHESIEDEVERGD